MALKIILQTLYFLLPAYGANMAPVIAQRLNFLKELSQPIDGGHKLFGEYIFGKNKTVRGIIVGAATAMFISYMQFLAWAFGFVHFMPIDYTSIDPLTFGLIGGIGALGGDLLKSFIKRRFHIAPGNPWPVFDQLDFIVGFFAAASLVEPFNGQIFLVALLFTLILHPLTNIAAYFLRIKNVWW